MVKCGLSSLIYKPAVDLCKAKPGGRSALTWFYIAYLTGPGCDQGTRKMSMTTVMIPAPLISHCNWGPRIIYSFAHSHIHSIKIYIECLVCVRHHPKLWRCNNVPKSKVPVFRKPTFFFWLHHVSMYAKSLQSCLFVTLWTVTARQAPLSMGFFR